MRARSPRLLATLLLSLTLCAAVQAAPPADEPPLTGTWKLVVASPLNDLEVLLIDVTEEGPKLVASLKDASASLPANSTKAGKLEHKGADVAAEFTIVGGAAPFQGRLEKDGVIYGTLSIRGQAMPARLEKTDAEKVSAGSPDRALMQGYFTARQDQDPKSKAKRLAALLEKAPASPKLSVIYADFLRVAEEAELPEQEVRACVEKWISAVKPYGAAILADARVKIVKALEGQKPFASLALDLALETEKALGADATTEARADVARGIASAAKLAGKADLAASAEAKLGRLDATLDEEYHKKVPPFKPEVSEGRKGGKGGRVVLFELFTGAQCPPCVAADVAFDALNVSYKPSELITLQYHLHIPGPDPLTSPDSVARVKYYKDFQGTPSTFFNGKTEAGGGGSMEMSRGKYDEYRQVIDAELERGKSATIDLQVDRDGDKIAIKADAHAEPVKDADAKQPPKLRLRLILIEEQVRYVGGNRLRFHHHIVRALPGGVDGKGLADGRVSARETVDLGALRKSLETYLSRFAKEGNTFPNPLPPIALENLSVVAFVQDDTDKSVWQAAQAPVAEAPKKTE